MRALIVVLAFSTAAHAGDKVMIAPVQTTVLEVDLAVEVEEAARSGVMRRAPELQLMVMSHATLARSLDDLQSGGRDKIIGVPCKSIECDAALGRALGTQLVVSTKVTKLDGNYVALIKLLQAQTDTVIASGNAEAQTFGALLPEVTRAAERLMGDGRAAAPQRRVVEQRTLRAGYVTIARAGELMGGYYHCELSTTALRCKTAGLFASGESLVIPFHEVTSVFPEALGRVAIETRHTTYKLGIMNTKEVDRNATVLEKELEKQRVAHELAQWRIDVDAAWRAFKGA